MEWVEGLDEYLAGQEPCGDCGREASTHLDEYGRYVSCFEQVLATLLYRGVYVD